MYGTPQKTIIHQYQDVQIRLELKLAHKKAVMFSMTVLYSTHSHHPSQLYNIVHPHIVVAPTALLNIDSGQ